MGIRERLGNLGTRARNVVTALRGDGGIGTRVRNAANAARGRNAYPNS